MSAGRRYWFALLSTALVLVWFSSFKIKPIEKIDTHDVLIEGIYLLAAIASYIIVRRLGIDILDFGWGLFTIGLLMDWLDEFTKEPDLISTDLEGIITSVGLILIAFGFYDAFTRIKDLSYKLETEIEERKKAEKRLKEANEYLLLLNRVLRHDISNDLMIVSNYLEIYEETPDRTFLEKIKDRINHSVRLIEDVRNLEKLVTTNGELKAMSLSNIIKEATKCLRYEARINLDVPDNVCVMADEMLSSVIENILLNAILHSDKEHVKIDISVNVKGDWVEVGIADNGPGIPDELKEKVFEEGYSGRGGSMGLGLYIVKKAMERFGGSVWIEDNEPVGTVFVLRFKKCD